MNLVYSLLTAFSFSLVINLGNAQTTIATKDQVVLGNIDTLYSEVLGEMREVWIHTPQAGFIGAQEYPVMYVLDGSGHFYSVAGMMHQLSSVNGNSLMPEMVVVGIPNTDRTRDLTPTHVEGEDFFASSGGGNEFLSFIEEELIPYVENNYPVTNYRTFVGHSFGGIAVLNALFERPELFANYVAIDPSMWWDDWMLVDKARTYYQEADLSGKSLYVGVANTMPEEMEIDDVRSDTSDRTDHMRSILEFVEVCENDQKSGLEFKSKYYPEDSHGSVPLITEYDAFRHMFSWYALPFLGDYFSPESEATADDLVGSLTGHYKTVSDHFGYPVHPAEGEVNGMGYGLMQVKPEIAKALFELNIENYPESANVYDSMGDYYMSVDDEENARKHFAKAYEIGGSSFTKEKLDGLNEKK